MKILVDENIDRDIVVWLEDVGHDILWIAETYQGATDKQLMEIARKEQRVILTKDTDFGELVFLWKMQILGVILLRFSAFPAYQHVGILQSFWTLERLTFLYS